MSEFGKKYEWLKRKNKNNYGFDYYDDFDIMDQLPKGWVDSFGHIFLEELDKEIKKSEIEDEYIVLWARESFYGFQWCDIPSNEEIGNIVKKHSMLSQYICKECGKPNVSALGINNGNPICKDCYEKHIEYTLPYKEVTLYKEVTMPTVMKYRRWSKEYNPIGWKDFEVDISETVEKIHRHWKERQEEKNDVK